MSPVGRGLSALVRDWAASTGSHCCCSPARGPPWGFPSAADGWCREAPMWMAGEEQAAAPGPRVGVGLRDGSGWRLLESGSASRELQGVRSVTPARPVGAALWSPVPGPWPPASISVGAPRAPLCPASRRGVLSFSCSPLAFTAVERRGEGGVSLDSVPWPQSRGTDATLSPVCAPEEFPVPMRCLTVRKGRREAVIPEQPEPPAPLRSGEGKGAAGAGVHPASRSRTGGEEQSLRRC